MTINNQDEIDFLDLIKRIYHWKFFILGIVISGLLFLFVLYYFAPVSYTSTGVIKIGKVAGTPIEKFEDLNLYLISLKKDDNYKTAEIIIDKKMSSPDLCTLVLSLSSKDSNFDESRKIIDQTARLITERHKKIYSDSMKKLKKIYLINNMHVAPNFYLFVSSYSYPTEVIEKIRTVQNKLVIKVSVDEKNKKSPIPLKSLSKYVIIIIIALAFIGIMMTFIIDYILSEIKKRKM